MAQHQNPQPVVLVVEDEALLRLHATNLLEEEGFEVLEAANAQQAIAALENRADVRVVFTDIQMPGPLDGMDLAREVHARWPHVLLLVTSGRLRPAPHELPDAGRFVAKPYRPEALVDEVKEMVGMS